MRYIYFRTLGFLLVKPVRKGVKGGASVRSVCNTCRTLHSDYMFCPMKFRVESSFFTHLDHWLLTICPIRQCQNTREKTRINLSNWWTTLSINNVRMLIQRFTLSVGTLQEWLSYNYRAVLAFTIGYILNVILKNAQVCQLSLSLQLKTTILFQLLRNHKTTITVACLR